MLLCGCASQHLTLQRNKDIIHRYFEEWGNHGDAKAADELIATNVTLRNPPAVLHSLEDYKREWLRSTRRSRTCILRLKM